MTDKKAQTVADVGEFGLLQRIKEQLISLHPADLIQGVGDDAAVIRIGEHTLLLASCDVLVETVHFQLNSTTPYWLGRRAMAVNLSDIASMGGRPRFALISLIIHHTTPLNFIDELYRGMGEQLNEFGAEIIGGNISHTHRGMIIDVFLLGETTPSSLLTRKGAQPNDRLYVTGQVGASAAGLKVLEKWGSTYPERYEPLVKAHRTPVPRINAGQLIAHSGCATAMIDISDGLVSDLHHLCESNAVGANIWMVRLPTPAQLDEVASITGQDRRELALYGGEDYELLFTVKPTTPDAVIRDIADRSHTQITEIGVITSGMDVVAVDEGNRTMTLSPTGWIHF